MSRDNQVSKMNFPIYLKGVSQMVTAHDRTVCGRHLPYEVAAVEDTRSMYVQGSGPGD